MSARSFGHAFGAVGLVAIGASVWAQGARVDWRTDYSGAKAAAAEAKKPLLIDFYAEWCGPCRWMDETTFQDAEVLGALRQMVCVRVDIDTNPGVADKFGVNSIPRVIALAPRAKDQDATIDVMGYVDAETLLSLLASSAKQLGGLRVTLWLILDNGLVFWNFFG